MNKMNYAFKRSVRSNGQDNPFVPDTADLKVSITEKYMTNTITPANSLEQGPRSLPRQPCPAFAQTSEAAFSPVPERTSGAEM